MTKKPRMRKRLKERKMRRRKTCPKVKKTSMKRVKARAKATTMVIDIKSLFI